MAKKHFQIGVDLGTSNLLVYINGNGVVYNEPSVIAFDKKTNKCIAVGKKASEMLGKEHQHIKIVRPLEGGVIADLDAMKAYLEHVLGKLESINVNLKNATLLICCPSETSDIERVALLSLSKRIGIPDCFIEQEVKAGAIGAGVDIFSPQGTMVIDIGGGTTDVGVLSLGDLVVSESIKVAGNFLDQEITKYIKFKYGLLIGKTTAEQIKIKLGTLREHLEVDKEFACAGRSIKNGLPTKITIKQNEIRSIFLKAFQSVSNTVFKVLQQTPPELASDIFENGVIINGGGSLVDGVKEYFEEVLQLQVSIAPNPLTSIVEGSRLLLQNRGNYLVKPNDY